MAERPKKVSMIAECAQNWQSRRAEMTPQLVRRLPEEREALQSEVQTLRRQLRYQCQRVRMGQKGEERAQVRCVRV